MRVIEARDAHTKDLFDRTPARIHGHDPRFRDAPPDEVAALFDAAGSDAVRYVLVDEGVRPLGRVAAFVRPDAPPGTPGGLGFFACPNDHAVASALFEAAFAWLRERGAAGVDGPINLGERDRFWGLLVDGFERPVYLENFNPEYYLELFTAAGFTPLFESVTWTLDVARGVPARLARVAAWRTRRGGFEVAPLDLDHLDRFVTDLLTIYRAAFRSDGRMRALDEAGLGALLARYAPLLRPDLVWMCRAGDRPAGVFVMMPDLNAPEEGDAKGILFAVAPEFQRRGVDALLATAALAHHAAHGPVRRFHAAGIAGQTAAMHNLLAGLGAARTRVHLTLRCWFDATRPVEKLATPAWDELQAKRFSP